STEGATPLANCPVLALRPALLEMNWLGLANVCRPAHNHVPVFVFTRYFLLKMFFDTVPLVRGQKLAIGQGGQPIFIPRNTGEFFYIAVPGSNIGVANWPIDRKSIAGR